MPTTDVPGTREVAKRSNGDHRRAAPEHACRAIGLGQRSGRSATPSAHLCAQPGARTMPTSPRDFGKLLVSMFGRDGASWWIEARTPM